MERSVPVPKTEKSGKSPKSSRKAGTAHEAARNMPREDKRALKTEALLVRLHAGQQHL